MTKKASDIMLAMARRNATFAQIMQPEAAPAAPQKKEEKGDANSAKSDGNK